MKHLNDNLPCVVDIKTTGNQPGVHDLWQLCVIPLTTGYRLNKTILPFHIYTHPKRPENFDAKKFTTKELNIIRMGAIDPWTAQDTFEHWYLKLNLLKRKRIQPIAYDWPKQRAFLLDWFGYDDAGDSYLFDFFDAFRYRDLIPVATFLNDLAWTNSEPYPIQKQNIAYICNRLNVIKQGKDCLSTCFAIAECWRKLTQMKLPVGFDNLDLRHPTVIDYLLHNSDEYEDPMFDVDEGAPPK